MQSETIIDDYDGDELRHISELDDDTEVVVENEHGVAQTVTVRHLLLEEEQEDL